MITITLEDIEKVVEPDPEGGIGVIARAHIPVPYGADEIIATLDSPGLWGIDADPDDPYLDEVFDEETEVLKELLQHLNVRVGEVRSPARPAWRRGRRGR